MITYISKIPLKPLSLLEFYHLLSQFHHLEDFNKPITKMDHGFIVHDSSVIGVHIEDKWIYEYIYEENTHELYICLDKRSNNDPIDFLGYLIKNDFILEDNNFKIKDTPHYLEKYKSINISVLPCIYFNEKLAKPKILNECSKLLKGMAHILYGNTEVDEFMKKHHHSNYHSYAILYNHDYIGFSKLNNETDEEFVKRIYYKIQTYMTKRVFDYPFNMNELYQKALLKMIHYYKNNEEEIFFEYDEKLQELEKTKKDYLDQINKLCEQIEYYKYEIENYQEIMKNVENHPLLYKGKIDEFYNGEQHDIVLALISEELKYEKDPIKIQLYNEILNENPEVGKRREKLDEIWNVLLSSKQVGTSQIEDLRKLGIILEKKGDNHYKGTLYSHPRYYTSIATTASDTNTGRQVYRKLRNHFFGNLNDKYCN